MSKHILSGEELEIHSAHALTPDITLFIHDHDEDHVGKDIIKDLKNKKFNIEEHDNGCLCGYKKGELNFEGRGMVLLNTLNGIGDNYKESMDCNEAVRKIVLDNPRTDFRVLNLGNQDFRKKYLGEASNLTYIEWPKDNEDKYTLERFMEEAYAIRR